MSEDETTRILEAHVNQLAEHFDAVQILVSWPGEHGETCGRAHGTGNWYARVGLATQFVERDRARTRADAVDG